MGLDRKRLASVRGLRALWARLKPREREVIEQLVEETREAAYLEGWDAGAVAERIVD